MALIVGVHGIAQQQLGRQQLMGVWAPALADGVEAALSGKRVAEVPFDLAYYGRVFLDPPGSSRSGSKGGAGEEDLADLTEVELEELLAAAEEAAGSEAMQVGEEQVPKGYSRVPVGLQVVFRALDWRFGPGAALLFFGAFQQVRRYLRDEGLKAAIDAVVDEAVSEQCRVLVGHSLGSVVAFEFVRRHPERRLDLLLTVGSPLGARFVRALMPDPDHGAGGLPRGVGAWVNVRDLRDPVAFAGDLSRHWARVDDVEVDNGGDAHSASRYLGKKRTGDALVEALPELKAG
ncbi:alpha/beta hydrolase (plasmid) [Streptomyces poriferorum]|uniref:alpha/beta fold hydrolase n=1 Tax=Streptomyces TaxID=1883 RepID=UPI00274005AA|nr:alpha/beta hydrolase [Streptomyces sp. Alt1]WLQ53709.1 alpha/beta hydrolase [Streptomyces sp. Alt1]